MVLKTLRPDHTAESLGGILRSVGDHLPCLQLGERSVLELELPEPLPERLMRVNLLLAPELGRLATSRRVPRACVSPLVNSDFGGTRPEVYSLTLHESGMSACATCNHLNPSLLSGVASPGTCRAVRPVSSSIDAILTKIVWWAAWMLQERTP